MPSKLFIEANAEPTVTTNVKLSASSMRHIRDLAAKTDRRISDITSILIDFALEHVEVKKRVIPVYDLQFKLPDAPDPDEEE